MADAYLKGFLPIRAAVVTGNHDLEGEEFETDAANLAAWTKVGAAEQPEQPASQDSAVAIFVENRLACLASDTSPTALHTRAPLLCHGRLDCTAMTLGYPKTG